MQRSWRNTRFLIAYLTAAALLPSCGSELEFKLVVTNTVDRTDVRTYLISENGTRISVLPGVGYDFEIYVRAIGDENFAVSASPDGEREGYLLEFADNTSGPMAFSDTKTESIRATYGHFDAGRSFVATGEVVERSLTVFVEGVSAELALEVEGRGAVTIDGGAESFTEGTHTIPYASMATTTLQISSAREAFLGWEGDCLARSGGAPLDESITLDLQPGLSVACRAKFEPDSNLDPVTVTVDVVDFTDPNSAPGRVISTGPMAGAIDCGDGESKCAVTVERTSDLQLVAEAHEGFEFLRWSDDACVALEAPGSKEISENLTCVATFRPTDVVCDPTELTIAGAMVVDGVQVFTVRDERIAVQVGGSMLNRPTRVQYAVFPKGAVPTGVDLEDELSTVTRQADEPVAFFVTYPFQRTREYEMVVRVTHDSCNQMSTPMTEPDVIYQLKVR